MASLRRRQPQRQLQPQSRTVVAPVGGINARDALAEMPETDAVTAVNCFGSTSFISVPRNGNILWASGLPGDVETVMAYNAPSGNKLFAASGNNIYDITLTGAVGAPVVTGTGNSRLQHQVFNAGGGTVLLWANGATQPQYYNGTSWAATTISGTGLTASQIITLTIFKQRVWAITTNSMSVWYSGTSAFQGTFTEFPLAGIFKKGGYLMQMATWTIDNVSGLDDYAAFITSEGEVAIYQGFDPTQASTWGLVGVFVIGRPIGRRCYIKYASDILILTADGLIPLSKAMLTDRTQIDANLTYKIQNNINTDIQQYNANFGWQIVSYPLGNKIIVNVPEVSDGTAHQWVMNPVAKSWWQFQGWNARCWELQQDSLYFGENTRVFLADVGTTDNGMAINCDIKPAFSYFGEQGMLKVFNMAQPVFQANAFIEPQVTLNLDYGDVLNPSPPLITQGISLWDTSPWDTTRWADLTPALSIKNWQGIAGLGYAASGRISMQLSGVVGQWYATNYLFTEASPL